MVTPTILSFNSIGMLFVTFAVFCCMSGVDVVTADDGVTVPSLEFFLFEQYVSVPGANITNILSSPWGGNMSMEWGNLAVSEQPVRASKSRSSPIIGNSPAFFYRNKRESNFSILKLITLNTDRYKGTIFAICDFNSLTDFESEVEFAVAGGTGSFRDSSGYAFITLASTGPDHNTFKWKVYLSTCKRHPLMFS